MTTDAAVTVIAHLHPAPEHLAAAYDAVRAAVPGIVAEDGCELYAPHVAADGSIVIVEKWSSRAALAAHDTGTAVQVLRSGLAGLTSAPAQVTPLDALPGDLPAGARL